MGYSRREFLMGCSAAIAAMASAKVGQMVFRTPGSVQAAGSNELFVLVFLRGGCDGLTLLSPFSDQIYKLERGGLVVPENGLNKAIELAPQNDSYSTRSLFGLPHTMGGLADLYRGGHLAMVHACGLTDDTRSHFDAMDYMERGTPGQKNTGSGWITRHIETIARPDGMLPVIAAGSAAPASLLNYNGAVALRSPRDFGLSTLWRYNRREENWPMHQALAAFYPEASAAPLDRAGRRTIETIDAIRERNPGNYTPEGAAAYPNGSFGDALKTVAQTAKMDIGLSIATVDFGGWDTHENQARNDGQGYLPERLGTLSQGLSAFFEDMHRFHDRLTVVVMSEFGRRLGRNASEGTDHGHGNVMMVLGGRHVRGGKMYGTWPGLEDLDKGQDLRITTDYRLVLSELLTRRLGNGNLGTIFPGLTPAEYTPLGILDGMETPINWADTQALPAPEMQQSGEHRIFLPLLRSC
jgi:uncharacterized protein (DUF1501 family)